jgi:hypothetical protein
VLPGRAQRERDHLARVAQRATAQLFEQQHQHVLHQVAGGGLAPQVLESIEADARA